MIFVFFCFLAPEVLPFVISAYGRFATSYEQNDGVTRPNTTQSAQVTN